MKQYAIPTAVIYPTDPEDILCLGGSVPSSLGDNETPGVEIIGGKK